MRATSLSLLASLFLAACGGGGGSPASAPAPAPASATGLDSRPGNTTCVAPQRPQVATGFQLARVFPGLSFDMPVGMYQPALDSSRWYVIEQRSGEWRQLTAAAAIAGVSYVTLHRAAVAGEIPYAKVAGRRFFAEVDLLAWRDERLGVESQ